MLRQCGRSLGLSSLFRGAAVLPLTEPSQWLATKYHHGSKSGANLMLILKLANKMKLMVVGTARRESESH